MSMSGKIRRPFIILLAVVPLATFLLFNAAVRVYFEKNARSELRAAAGLIGSALARQQADDGLNKSNVNKVLTGLRGKLRAAKSGARIEVFIFDKDNELLYTSGEDTYAGLSGRIALRLPQMKTGSIYTVRELGERFLVMPFTGEVSAAADRPTVVLVVPMTAGNTVIRTFNLILICIMLLGVIAAALIAGRIASGIAQPVVGLSKRAEDIGSGNFAALPRGDRPSGIREIDLLYRSFDDMAGRLEAYDKTQKTFLQNASHELKTPLMSIRGYAEGIAKGVLPDTEKAAGIICDESVRLSSLVDELLTLSRIESRTYGGEMGVLNLGDTLKDYAQRLGGLASASGRQLKLIVPEEQVLARAGEELLSQTVGNIVSNCLRYAKTAVVIELLRQEQSAVIRITDDGGGIAPEDLPHLFERFYKGKGGNFGLGLAIAQTAARAMNGSIEARNTGEGAQFDIILPAER